MGLFLSKYLLIATAALAALGAFTGWRWLEVREALAVERSQYKQAVAGFEAQLQQIQHNEQLAREASREYQVRLSALQSESAALRESNRGLRLVAYRSLQPAILTPARLTDAPTESQRDSGTEVDIARLERLATNCQADAEQLAALIQWTSAQAGNKND